MAFNVNIVHLLQIGLAVDLYLIGLVLIRRDRKAGDESVCRHYPKFCVNLLSGVE